jgi:hypothetical protein
VQELVLFFSGRQAATTGVAVDGPEDLGRRLRSQRLGV